MDPFQPNPLASPQLTRTNLMQNSVMPTLSQPQAPIPAPILSQPQTITYHNPLADIYGASHESVLSTQPQQDKMGAAFNKFLQSAVEGVDARSRDEMAAPKIFGGAVAMLGGLTGNSQGGLQVLQQTQQQIQEAKNERRLQQQDSIVGMKTLADLIGNTSPYSQKALASRVKAELEAADAERKTQKDNTNNAIKADKNSIHLYTAQHTARHNQVADALKAYGLIQAGDEFDQKLQVQQQLAALADQTKREIANLAAQTANNKMNADWQKHIQQLQQKWEALKLTRLAIASNMDSQAKMKLAGVYQNGMPRYNGEEMDIPSLTENLLQDITESESDMPWAQQGQQPAASPIQQPPQLPPSPAMPQQKQASAIPAITDVHKEQFRLANQVAGMGGGNKQMFIAEAQNRGLDPQAAEQLWKRIGGK